MTSHCGVWWLDDIRRCATGRTSPWQRSEERGGRWMRVQSDGTRVCVVRHLIRVCALRRSGHHAVIQWCLVNGGRPAVFINDCVPGTDPYVTGKVSESVAVGVPAQSDSVSCRKDLFIVNFEDRGIESCFDMVDVAADMRWLGGVERTTNVVVLRDPFNNLASKLFWARSGRRWAPTVTELRGLLAMWKTHARAFLARASLGGAELVCVNFNAWVSNRAYRRHLAAVLELRPDDRGRGRVARWGPNTWGDSVDNLRYDGRAWEMKTVDRWQAFADDPFFRELIRGEDELFELSDLIFGPIPGTEVLRR
jgi:hypothetical protein